MMWFNNVIPQIISFENISHITKQVSEQIKQKYLNSFLKTTILESNIMINKTTVVHFVFIQETKTYEIYIFSKKGKYNILEMQFLENYYKLKNLEPCGYDLFVCDEFFVLLLEGKFLLFMENKNYQSQDIEKFVQFAYGIMIKNTFQISTTMFKTLANDSSYIKLPKYIYLDKMHDSYYFLTYTILFSFLFIYLYQNDQVLSLAKRTNIKPQTEQKGNHHKKILPTLIDFSNKIAKVGVHVRNLHYEGTISAVIVGSSDAIYEFINCYDQQLNVLKMEKLDNNISLIEVIIEQ